MTREDLYERAVGSIAHMERDLTGFEFDLMNVAEHIMKHKFAVGLPWEGGLRRSRSTIQVADQLDHIRTAHFERGHSIQKRLQQFESYFVGVPAYVLEDKRLAFVYCREGVLDGAQRFGDFVEEHARASAPPEERSAESAPPGDPECSS